MPGPVSGNGRPLTAFYVPRRRGTVEVTKHSAMTARSHRVGHAARACPCSTAHASPGSASTCRSSRYGSKRAASIPRLLALILPLPILIRVRGHRAADDPRRSRHRPRAAPGRRQHLARPRLCGAALRRAASMRSRRSSSSWRSAQAPLTPLCDLVTTDAVRADPRLDYGRIRLWGSRHLPCREHGRRICASARRRPTRSIGLLAALAIATFGVVPLAVPDVAMARGPRRRQSRCRGPKAQPPASGALWLLIAAAGLRPGEPCGRLRLRQPALAGAGLFRPGRSAICGPSASSPRSFCSPRAAASSGRQSAGLGLLLIVGAGAAVLRFSLMAGEPGLAAVFRPADPAWAVVRGDPSRRHGSAARVSRRRDRAGGRRAS